MTVDICNAVSAPKALDADFFQEVLENSLLEAYVSVKKISFESGSAAGDNYCSEIFRVKITYQRDDGPVEILSVIVKSIPIAEFNQFLDDMKVFLKEKIFYFHLLPRMELLLDPVKIGPTLYHTLKMPVNTLVFEDLSALGYVMADREKGLDIEHSRLVMRKLGQLHGASMVLQKKDPDSMHAFRRGMLNEKTVRTSKLYEAFFGNNLNGLIGLVQKWRGFESITRKLEKYRSKLHDNLIKSQTPHPGEMKVLNHGDLWVNNMLFKYSKTDKKHVDDVLYVDLQMSIYGSPGYDINYFFYTSLQLDVLKEKRQDLLKTYHESLCEVLGANNFKDIPSFETVLTEVRRRESYGFFANYAIFPTIAMDKSQSGDNSLDNFMDEDFAKKKAEIIFSSKRLTETMRYTLPEFDKMGVFD